MSKLIEIDSSNIKRYYPNEKIFNNIISFLNDYFPNSAIIAGGAARYMLSPNKRPSKPDDIDIFLFNQDITGFYQQHFIDRVFSKCHIRSKIMRWLELIDANDRNKIQYSIRTLVCQPFFPNIQFISVNKLSSIANSLDTLPTEHWPTIEAIISTAEVTDEIIVNNFDFTICQASIIPVRDKLVHDKLVCKVAETFMDDEKKRLLQITGTHSESLMARIYKYAKLGYSLSEESYIHILNHIANTTDSYEKRLGHQVLKPKRNSNDFIIAPYALELYSKWLKSMQF